ncbi:hypothetical protein [Methanosarcina sp. KYL-1]|uniref:hypothetical protein n=1 Tax=Methanosarcina sp. KYL-1 TaxID=2602068 RepID=UPI002101B6BA|nr:hypothetical protein [Methanosarcina sp. KYL-1]
MGKKEREKEREKERLNLNYYPFFRVLCFFWVLQLLCFSRFLISAAQITAGRAASH